MCHTGSRRSTRLIPRLSGETCQCDLFETGRCTNRMPRTTGKMSVNGVYLASVPSVMMTVVSAVIMRPCHPWRSYVLVENLDLAVYVSRPIKVG